MNDRNLMASVDLGQDQFVVLVAAKMGTSFEVVGYGFEAARGYSRGMITDIDEASAALAKAVRQAEIMAGSVSGAKISLDGHVYGGVSGGHIQGKDQGSHYKVQGGAVSQADIDSALDTIQAFPVEQGMRILHVLPQEYKLDGQVGIRHPKGMHGSLLEADAHAVYAASNALANINTCLGNAGAKAAKLVATALASGDSVTTEDEKELGVVALDWGCGTCDCTVFKDGVVRMLRTMRIGGCDIDRDIAKVFHIPISSAERIKCEIGNAEQVGFDEGAKITVASVDSCNEVEIEPHVLSSTIQARVDEMLEQVKDALGEGINKDSMPAGVVISGGMANLAGMVRVASEVLEMPVRTSRANYTGKNAEVVSDPEFAASLGLLERMAMEAKLEPLASSPTGGLGSWLAKKLFGGATATNTTQSSTIIGE